MEHFQSIIPQRPHHPSLLISLSTLRRFDGGSGSPSALLWLCFWLGGIGGVT
jgi:hypothetical protein